MSQNRYINADVFLSKLPSDKDEGEIYVPLVNVKNAVNESISANVEPITIGYWIELPFGELRCSVCGILQEDFPHKYKRCPECGARMQGWDCNEQAKG